MGARRREKTGGRSASDLPPAAYRSYPASSEGWGSFSSIPAKI